MMFGGDKTPEKFQGLPNPRDNTVEVEGMEDFGSLMFSLFRLTLVDEYDYPVSLLILILSSIFSVQFCMVLCVFATGHESCRFVDGDVFSGMLVDPISCFDAEPAHCSAFKHLSTV